MGTHVAVVVALLTVAAAPSAASAPGPLERGGVPARIVPGRALLLLRGIDAHRIAAPRKGDDAARTALANLGARHGVALALVRPLVFGWALVEIRDAAAPKRMPSEDETEALLDRIARDDALTASAPEHWWKKLAVPNDPGLAQMWHFDAIGAEQAWDVTTGNPGQRIGIVDTGLVRAHEDVGSRAVNGFDFVSDPNAGNDGDGRDGDYDDPGDACGGEPSSFHGTHVAGTIGARANNGRGVAGLNWNAGLVVARVLGRCGGTDDDIMEGAAWLAGAHIDGVPDVGADQVSVMNLSLGGSAGCSSFDQQVVSFIDQQGAVFVAAAGNDSGPVGSPADCSGAVAVAAFGPSGNIAGYSSFGPEVSIVAPGGDESVDGQAGGVLSTLGPQAAGYGFLEGTSMAAPHVTGAVSLLQAVQPGLTRAQIVGALQASTSSCGGCGGVPVLNIPTALAAVGASSPPPPPPPSSPPPPSANDDAFEPNDDLAQATPASCGIDDASLVAAPGNMDVFTLTPPANSPITLSIHALNGADLDLYVVDMQGNVLAASDSTSGDESISGTAGGARLGVVVNPYVDSANGVMNTGPYELRVDCGQAQAQGSGGDFVPGLDGGATGGVDDGSGASTDPKPAPGANANGANGANGAARGAVDDAGQPFAEGGCTSSGASPVAVGALALAALFARRRRRRG